MMSKAFILNLFYAVSSENVVVQYPLLQYSLGIKHFPSKHISPKGQAFPHEPQFSSSLVISMHVPLQKLKPAGHMHSPLMQSFPGGQVFPHVPQFLKSKLVSVHVPLHRVRPARHEHVPLLHAFPRGQTFPHAPQFSTSTLVSTQVPLQSIWPGRHVELPGTSAMLSIVPQASASNIRHGSII